MWVNAGKNAFLSIPFFSFLSSPLLSPSLFSLFLPFNFFWKVIYFSRNGTMLHFALRVRRYIQRPEFTSSIFCGIFNSSAILLPGVRLDGTLHNLAHITIDIIMTSDKRSKWSMWFSASLSLGFESAHLGSYKIFKLPAPNLRVSAYGDLGRVMADIICF